MRSVKPAIQSPWSDIDYIYDIDPSLTTPSLVDTHFFSHSPSECIIFIVGCNLTFPNNGRSGASPILGLFCCKNIAVQSDCSISNFREGQVTCTMLTITQQFRTHPGSYRAGTLPSVFREGWVTPNYNLHVSLLPQNWVVESDWSATHEY